jgi:hypothetical protein
MSFDNLKDPFSPSEYSKRLTEIKSRFPSDVSISRGNALRGIVKVLAAVGNVPYAIGVESLLEGSRSNEFTSRYADDSLAYIAMAQIKSAQYKEALFMISRIHYPLDRWPALLAIAATTVRN